MGTPRVLESSRRFPSLSPPLESYTSPCPEGLTLFRLMLFHVVGDRDHPFGIGYFVLLLTLMCQLGCALHVSAPRNVPVGPRVC